METTVTRAEIEPGMWLDARRALWLEASRSLIVADLHWGYAAAHRAAGHLLPAWGDEELERTLQALLRDYPAREMIWLGDTIHHPSGRARAEDYVRTAAVPLLILRGNHDRAWAHVAETPTVEREGFTLHHGDRPVSVPAGRREMVGHHHPALVWRDGAGGRLRLPALVTGPRRWILPAFSPWAAGVPWNDQVANDERLWAIAPRRIFAVSRRG